MREDALNLSPITSVQPTKVQPVTITRIEKPPGRHAVITPEREAEIRASRARERSEFGSDYNVVDGLLDLITSLRQ